MAAAQRFELKVASEQRRAASDQTAELVAAAAHKHTNSSETETPAGDILITPLDIARFRKCTSSCGDPAVHAEPRKLAEVLDNSNLKNSILIKSKL